MSINEVRGLVFFLSMFFIFLLPTETICQQLPVVYVTMNNNQSQEAHAASSATAVSYAVLCQWYEQYKTQGAALAKTFWQQFKTHLWRHKIAYFLYGATGVYGGLWVYLYSMEQFLDDQSRWHNWSLGDGTDELYAADHGEVAQKLLHEIQKRYFAKSDPSNSIAPLICFFNQIEKEKLALEWYGTLLKWIAKVYLHKLPFLQVPCAARIKEAKKQLLFLENICKSCCCNYNIKQLYES